MSTSSRPPWHFPPSRLASLSIETAQGFVVIDHKSFPGSADAALSKAKAFSGQLQAYADAVHASSGKPVVSMWIHFPVLGMMAEVCTEQV